MQRQLKYRIPPLNALRAFEAAARNLSFTKAGSELNVTQGAVSRQVRMLEEFFGFELFERTPRGVELNRVGEIYATAMSEVLEKITRATDELATARTHTILTLRGYTNLLVRWLTPLLPDFHVQHPNIEVRLICGGDPVDFDRDKVDLGIRYGFGQWQNLESDPLFKDELTPVCSPSVREAFGLREPGDLDRCPLLHLNRRQADWPDWFAQAGVQPALSGPSVHLEDLGVAYQCAIAGQGVAMGQIQYVREYLANGQLVAPFASVLRRDAGYFLVCPKERSGLAKIVAFRKWLSSTLAAPERAQWRTAQTPQPA
ncbi:MAG: transcriptional regulator GcvA [Pseudomonadota bacterium]